MLSSRKSKLAAVGAVGIFGALGFGGIAYAVGGEDPAARPAYVTVVDEPSPGESSQPPRSDNGQAPRDGRSGDKRDCPEKSGGQTPSETPSAPSETPSEQQPQPGSAENL